MEQLTKQVRRAQRLLGLERLVHALGWSLFGTLSLAALLITIDKFRPLGVVAWGWGVGAVVLGILLAVVWACLRGRGPVDAAIEIDQRFGLKERVSSTLALSEEEQSTEAGQALIEDAVRRVDRIEVSEHFSVTPSRRLLLPLAPAIVAFLVAWLVAPAANNTANATNSLEAKKQIERSTDALRQKLIDQQEAAKKSGLKDAEMLFKRLEEEAEKLTQQNEGDRKEALVKLNDLYRQMEKRQKQLGGVDQMKKHLDQMKDVGKGPAEKFSQAAAQGDLKKAMQELEKLKKQVASGEMSKEDQQLLAEQLKKMQEKLQEQVENQKKAQEELEKRIQQAEQAGDKDEANRLEEQLDKLRQQMPQMNALNDLAQQLGNCSQCLGDGDLQNAAGALSQMQSQIEDLQQQLAENDMLDQAMDQLCQARDQMNCGNCDGEGCGMCQGGGEGDKPGQGMGEGQGKGDRPEEETEYGVFDTKVRQKLGPGSATVVGEVEGPNIKGDVRQEIQEQLQSSEIEAADPLTGQQIPRGHQQHARDYFDRLREGE